MSLPPATTELSALRDSLRTFLNEHGEPADDWLLIATELVTNAIAAAPVASEIDVQLSLESTHAELRVVDKGDGFEHRPASTVSPDNARGRGLLMVSALADEFFVTTENGQTVATARRSIRRARTRSARQS